MTSNWQKDKDPVAYSTSKLAARYLYQILVGCGERGCRSTFCRTNSRAHILGRKISKSAALPLAFQLTSLYGVGQLCDKLTVTSLPPYISKHINELNPSKSPLLDNNGCQSIENSKSSNGLAAGILKSESIKRWPTFDTPLLELSMIHYLGESSYKSSRIYKASKFDVVGSHMQVLVDPFCLLDSLGAFDVEMLDGVTDEIKDSVAYERVGGFSFSRYLSYSLSAARSMVSSDKVRRNIDRMFGSLVTKCGLGSGSALCSVFPIDEQSMIPELTNKDPLSRAVYFASASRYISRWPFHSYYTTRLQYLRKMMELQQGVDQNGPFLIYSHIIASANGYFKRIPQLPDAVYMSELLGMLPPKCRYQLFRYGFLRQMNTVVHRFYSQKMLLFNFRRLTNRHVYSTKNSKDTTSFAPISLKSLINCEFMVFDIDRDNTLSSAIEIVSRALMIEDLLRRPLRVKFGAGELAVDQGGVQIEFFRILGQQMCYSGHGFFTVDKTSQLAYFNPAHSEDPSVYEYLGILFGLAIYNGCIIGISFPSFVYAAIKAASFADYAKRSYSIDEYRELFPLAAASLASLSSVKDLSTIGLSFEYTCESSFPGSVRTVSLPSATRFSQVTRSNLNQYVDEYITCALYTAVEPCFRAFVKGARFMISQELLNLVSVEELKLFTEGTNKIDIEELQAHTTYIDGYNRFSPTIVNFWKVLSEFTHSQLENFLEFVTGSRRVPIGGMKELDFAIQRNGVDNTKLPTASVCFFRLFLPVYKTKKELKDRLLIAIENSSGFGLV
jgi:hypothetical protein